MARSGLKRMTACAALVLLTSMAIADDSAPNNSQAQPARSARGNIGTFTRAKVYAAYWQTAQYNASVDQFNSDLQELGSKPETDELTLRRTKLKIASRNIQASFDRDLTKAVETVMKNHHVLIIIRGVVTHKAEGIETIDLTEPLIALLDHEPNHEQP
ncbi:MAG: hypothetical protein WBF93_06935 [Pirellulales bacterium]